VEINTEKETKIMAFQGMESVGGKISINDGIPKQIDACNSLECNIYSYEEERR
jgi:hypothetical protein